MADFKDEISPALVRALADELRRAWPALPVEQFVAQASDGLDRLELKARVAHVVVALRRALPPDFASIVKIIDRALRSPGLDGWMMWPITDAVAEAGIDDPHLALPLLARLTPRWTSEGAVRPFIERYPEIAFEHLRAWANDPDEHVRRLVSEGTRPRLPWSSRLGDLHRDPAPAIELLDALWDDPAEYVRRSVSNHLNDIAKDHPALAIATARRWLAEGGEHAEWVARRGLRTLIKAGDPNALALLGYDPAAAINLADFTLSPTRIQIGESASISFTLATGGDDPVRAMIDYIVWHVGARGDLRPKVFKLTDRVLHPGATDRIEKAHPFREVSVRQLYPGLHRVEIQVNGRVLGGDDIELARS
ncbi:MAG TPA: hypothetical protein VML96_04340 [Egibacteraceae bacterium]|nr:hypothetical protein [Egibacteraceae bacterium]